MTAITAAHGPFTTEDGYIYDGNGRRIAQVYGLGVGENEVTLVEAFENAVLLVRALNQLQTEEQKEARLREEQKEANR